MSKALMFKSWSQSRLSDYEECPLKAKHKHLLKTCTLCFDGKIMGGYDSPAVCDTCGETIEMADALARGSAVGLTLENYVKGTGKLHPEIRHPKIKELAKSLRDEHKKNRVRVEFMLVFDKNWKFIGHEWSPQAWLIVKLDVLRMNGGVWRVIDWKTGGIDKKTGDIKPNEKYEDQLNLYSLAVLLAYPDVEATEAALAFVDCGPRFHPIVEKPSGSLVRADLPKAKALWEKKVKALLRDEVFAPRPSGRCGYCPYSQRKNGPCQY